jgi:hypothetical protein
VVTPLVGVARDALTMATLDELDQPGEWGDPFPTGHRARSPARFDAMSADQLRGWPARATRRWLFRRAPLTLLAVVAGVIVWRAGWPGTVAVAVAGLVLAIIGVALLAEGVLLSDEDAVYLSTGGGIEHRYLLAQRDRRQATFGLFVAVCGFVLQIAAALIAQPLLIAEQSHPLSAAGAAPATMTTGAMG